MKLKTMSWNFTLLFHQVLPSHPMSFNAISILIFTIEVERQKNIWIIFYLPVYRISLMLEKYFSTFSLLKGMNKKKESRNPFDHLNKCYHYPVFPFIKNTFHHLSVSFPFCWKWDFVSFFFFFDPFAWFRGGKIYDEIYMMDSIRSSKQFLANF